MPPVDRHLVGASLSGQVRPRKCSRGNLRSEAAVVLAPRFLPARNIDQLEWQPCQNAIKKSTASVDAGDLRAMLAATSRGNPQRAATAICRVLSDKSNKALREIVVQSLTKTTQQSTEQLVVESIQECASFHTVRTSRTRATETLIKNISMACMFKIVKDKKPVSNYVLHK